MMSTATTDRVQRHTSDRVKKDIQEQTRANVVKAAAQGLQGIEERLAELNDEWDVERTLETNASTLIFIGTALGAFVDRRLLAIPAIVSGFLLQHALQGWCPPLALFRRLGVRTNTEIDQERFALKALRGDFKNTRGDGEAANALEAFEAACR